MKTELAMRLISEQMQWEDDSVAAQEFARLKLMVDYKYDHYHGYQPGSRFYVAIIGWLSQFRTIEERYTAYDFLKNNLVFICQREMHHLVSLLMPIVDRELRKEVAAEMGIPLYETWLKQEADQRIRLRLRRTLFIALSDGARIDVFRRYNEGLVSNEQVLASSEISIGKWRDLLKNAKKSLKADGISEEEAYFERVCLVDDFTGSGSSLIRNQDREWKGKIFRFCELYEKWKDPRIGEKWHVQIHHHLASAKARSNIATDLAEYSKHPSAAKFQFSTTYSYVLPDDIVISDKSEAKLAALIDQYYDANIEDEHTGKDIWFGYRQSGLPLVLDHNTPNNSVALLWAESPPGKEPVKHPMQPLFIRRKRHSSHG